MPLMIEPWVDSNSRPKMSKSLGGEHITPLKREALFWAPAASSCGRLLDLHQGDLNLQCSTGCLQIALRRRL